MKSPHLLPALLFAALSAFTTTDLKAVPPNTGK